MHEADSLLFLGYGFGDLHLNAAFSEVRDRHRPIVLVDWADDNQDPLPFRNDTWSYNLFKALPGDAHAMSSIGHSAPADLGDLRAARELEVSNNPTYPFAFLVQRHAQSLSASAKNHEAPSITAADSRRRWPAGFCPEAKHSAGNAKDSAPGAAKNEDAGLLVLDRHVEHLGEHRAPHVGQPARPVRLLRLHAGTARRRAAALRVAFDQRDETIVGQLLVFGAQAPARRRVALHARAQALVQQNGAGIERLAADQAGVLFEGNV